MSILTKAVRKIASGLEPEASKFKQAILIRTDLKMNKGKIATQAAHASVEAVLRSDPATIRAWRIEGMKKIVLKVYSKKELFEYKEKADKYGIINAVIQDAGKTQVKAGSVTALAIGPAKNEKIDDLISDLHLL